MMRLGPGTYVLVLRLDQPVSVCVGALGARDLAAGWYLYVGSALGGLRSRLSRHLRTAKRLHWHIDYLLTVGRIESIWYREGYERLECAWAHSLAAREDVEPALAGFGASDCTCATHLFRCAAPPRPLPGCQVLDPTLLQSG